MKCDSCRGPLSPVIAFDIDGTLADYHMWFFMFALQWLGADRSDTTHWFAYDGSVRIAEWMGIEDRTYREIKLAYRQGGMKRSMPSFRGAKDLVQSAKDAGAEVWITTTRPYLRLDNIDPDTREWLRRNEIPYDKLIYEDDKYHRLIDQVGADRIVCVFEDLLECCTRAEDLGLVAWQPETPWNTASRHYRSIGNLLLGVAKISLMIDRWRQENGVN